MCALIHNTGSHLETCSSFAQLSHQPEALGSPSWKPDSCRPCLYPGKCYWLSSIKNNCRVHVVKCLKSEHGGLHTGPPTLPFALTFLTLPSLFPESEHEKKRNDMKRVQPILGLQGREMSSVLTPFACTVPQESTLADSSPTGALNQVPVLWVSPSPWTRVSSIKNTYLVEDILPTPSWINPEERNWECKGIYSINDFNKSKLINRRPPTEILAFQSIFQETSRTCT